MIKLQFNIEGKNYLHPFVHLMGIYIISSFFALTINIPSVVFGFDIAWREGVYLIVFGIVGIIVMFTIETAFIYFTVKPLTAALTNFSGQRNERTKSALIRTMNLPIISAFRVAFIHSSTFIVPFLILTHWGIKAGYIDAERLPTQKLIFMSSVMYAGCTAHILLEYFLVQIRFLPYFELFAKDAQTSHLYELKTKILNTPIFAQIIVVFVLLLFIPVSCLLIGFYFKSANQFSVFNIADKFSGVMLPVIRWGTAYSITSIVITISFAFLFSKGMQKKVKIILDGLKSVEQGEFGKEIKMYSSDEFRDISLGYNRMTDGLLEKEFIKDTFGKYVPVEVRDKILKGHLELGGEERYATVLFCDIRDFTSFSERHEPHEAVKRLNEYFTEMVKAITKNGGVVDKFIGDAIMAVFGIPLEMEDHEQKAVEAAVEMRLSLARLNEMWKKIG
ncbi:MAG: adenylate/guanylate cyclase domain-containing protein, partial [bacterium]